MPTCRSSPLATVGYGDVTPAYAPAGTLASLEAVTDQLYLAITVARLVARRCPREAARAPRRGTDRYCSDPI
jgi:hypothetical protein